MRFFLVFIALVAILFGLNMLQVVQQNVVLPWTALLAQICAWLVTTFDHTVMASGKVLWDPATGLGVSIEPGCNGVEACLLLFSAVLAYPSSWSAKFWGMTLGFVAIQIVNIARVISLFYLQLWDKAVFDFAHEYLWQALIMLDVFIVWLLWVRRVSLGAPSDANDDAALPPPPAAHASHA